MPTIAVTRKIPEAGLQPLREAGDLRLWPGDLPPNPQQLAELLHGCDGALTMVNDTIDAALLDAAPSLRVVSTFAVGYDNIDVQAATSRGIAICNTPGVLTESTADAAFSLLIAAARRIPEGIAYVREGQWRAWSPMVLLGHDIHGATVGIIGMGRIGQAFARRARGFDMKILYHNRERNLEAERELGAIYVPLDELLGQSDFISLHVALNAETKGLIGARELGLMRREAILINAARGPVIDTAALVTALQEGTIGGAALDVTDPEPLPATHPLVNLPNAIIVPHTASSTIATRDKMALMAAHNLLAVLNKEQPASIVNPAVLDRR
jgi:glyoxylate reductase